MIVAHSVQQTSPTGEDSAICGGALVWSGAHRTATIKDKHPLRGDASPSGLVSTGCPSQVRKLQTWAAANHTLWLAVASPQSGRELKVKVARAMPLVHRAALKRRVRRIRGSCTSRQL